MSEAGAPHPTTLLVVSGMSGSGKSVVLHTLEDLGFYCTDNLPADLMPEFVQNLRNERDPPSRLAVSIDVRNRELARIGARLAAVGTQGIDARLVFLDTTDDVLIRRYSESRRKHPLSHRGLALAEAIALEREMLQPLKTLAGTIIDTSQLNIHQLRHRIVTEFGLSGDAELSLLFQSFAYRHGVPADADFVFDARGLPNPHWTPELRPLSGRDAAVREHLDAQAEAADYFNQVAAFLDDWLPKMRSATRSYVTVAFGCTGGRHRSVYLAEKMAAHAREGGWTDAAVFHRELD